MSAAKLSGWSCAALWAVRVGALARPAPREASRDTRFRLRLILPGQAGFLAEMQLMPGSVQAIVQGIADSDGAAIARLASVSGKRMARATPPGIVAKLPPAFAAIGEPTHLMFDELAVRAETDDMDMLTRQLAQTLRQCVACHAAFTVK